jgi:osmotically-inducible protein OsmY
MRTPITFAMGVAAGAVAARALASRRSHDMAAHVGSTASSAASSMQSTATHAAQHAKGAVHAAMPSRTEPLDDVSLARKVESEIFRPVDAPKGDVSVDVQAGVATLRGEVPEPWISKLGDEAGHVDGVQGVQNLLHTPGTPAPAAAPRGWASERLHH